MPRGLWMNQAQLSEPKTSRLVDLSRDSCGRGQGVLMFPDPDRQPPFRRQLLVGVAISALVAGDLLRPVPRVLYVVHATVLLAAVPEAPVDKHRHARTRKHNVSLPTQLG